MKRLFLSIIFLLCIATLFFANANFSYAWVGAGITPGWANAYDGLTGSMINGSYNVPPASYNTNQSIQLQFQVSDPIHNPAEINKQLYLKIYTITHSPISQDLSTPNASSDISLSENDLYMNNKEGNDYQILYKTIPVGSLVLSQSQSSNFSVTATIENPGYYQFDLTDLNGSTAYVPGHIYAAGFLRVVNASQDNSDTSNNNNNNNNNSNTNSNSSGTTSSSSTTTPTPTGQVLVSGVAASVMGSQAEGPKEKKNALEALSAIKVSACSCNWLPMVIGLFVTLLLSAFFLRNKSRKVKLVTYSIEGVIWYAIFFFLNKECGIGSLLPSFFTISFCNDFIIIDILLVGIFSLLPSFSKKS